jgi:photosystem II stability/assembly factor-like uncharacterized protein
MVIGTQSGVRWKFLEKPLVSFVIFQVLIFSGFGSSPKVNLAQEAIRSETLGAEAPAIEVLSLAIDPTKPATLYAGAKNAGVFKSSDGGTSWTAINTGLPSGISVSTLVISPMNPSTLYVGTNQDVFKTSDGGESWRALNLTRSVTAMLIDPQTPSRLYAAGACNGVYRSNNEGTSWTAINTGLTGFFFTSLAIDPASPSTLYAGTIESLSKTTNGGASWRTIYVGLSIFGVSISGVTALIVDPITPTTIYLGITGSGEASGGSCRVSWDGLTPGILTSSVIKSVDGGMNWNAASVGLRVGVSVIALAIDPLAPMTVYVGTKQSGVFKSNNGGETWTAINNGLPEGIAVYALAVDPQTPSTLYAGTNQGLFKSTNAGEQWDAAGPK